MKRYDDKAQLLLLAGFAVGVGIVVLTIMLNNVIYASNIASESSIDTARYDISNALEMTTQAYENAYQSASVNGSVDNVTFEQELEIFAETASKSYAISGHTFSIENSARYDPYMTQNGLASGKDDWTIVSNINTTDEFVLDIPDVSKLGNSSNSLMITATNSTGLLWSIEIYNSSGQRYFVVKDHNMSIIENGTTVFDINVTGESSYKFIDNTQGKDYSINIIGGSNTIALFTLIGNHTTGEPFTFIRHYVAEPTVTIYSSDVSITRSLPISLPGRIS
ncbi:hypothetical protein RE474_05710 [Methanolobus sediminis]|uniref:Uncharacterized protein n=1 Tax=Methanolobus sediminis TaxID=3072978 RepID=A0AA51UMX8_9EURY|nr:hypothetical protein [Methanolobus sediminis]WMW26207.1 hypothetical protein RE474_05710 [Methanolobus sediminis]